MSRMEEAAESTPATGAAEPRATHGELRLSLTATVLDVGLAGLALESGTRLTPQGSLTLGLDAADGGGLEIEGRVVWCFFHGTAMADNGEQVPVYRAGVEFQDVLTPVAERLLAFLEGRALVTGETRLFGRFRVANAGPVELRSTSRFQAVGLDAASGNLRIETALSLEPVPGATGVLRLLGEEDDFDRVTVVDARRLPASAVWALELALDDRSPAALALLRERAGL